jgi:hypothetical protein
MNINLIKFSSFIRALPKYSSLLLMLVLFPSEQLIADERAKKGKCYITTGYVENKSLVEAAAKKLYINFSDFELFERKDKKIYLTIGKAEKKLFDKLKSDAKTYDFNCSQGKGFQKRYSFDENFKLVEGRKKFIDFESDYYAVIAPIEAEKKRLVDAEVQRQVEARMELMRLAEIKKQEQAAAAKERLRLAEIARKKKAEADRLASIAKAKQDEIDRIAAIEKAKQDEILRIKQAETDRLASIAKAKQDEIDRIAAIEKAKQDEILRKKQAAEKKRKAQLAAEKLAKEFPFYMKVTCGTNGQHFGLGPCFIGEYSTTEIELQNGSEYGLYVGHQVGRVGKEYSDGLKINLRANFNFIAQNSADYLILGVKVFDRRSGTIVFQKQASQYRTIRVSN